MKILALIFLILAISTKLIDVFLFGKERNPLTPLEWTLGLAINLPVYYILYIVATT